MLDIFYAKHVCKNKNFCKLLFSESSENKTISNNQTKISKRQLDTFGFGFGFRPELRPRFGFQSRFDNNGMLGTGFGGNVISPGFARFGNRARFMVALPKPVAHVSVPDQIVDVGRPSTGQNPNGLVPPSKISQNSQDVNFVLTLIRPT